MNPALRVGGLHTIDTDLPAFRPTHLIGILDPAMAEPAAYAAWRPGVELADAALAARGRLLAPLDRYRGRYPNRLDAYKRLHRRRAALDPAYAARLGIRPPGQKPAPR